MRLLLNPLQKLLLPTPHRRHPRPLRQPLLLPDPHQHEAPQLVAGSYPEPLDVPRSIEKISQLKSRRSRTQRLQWTPVSSGRPVAVAVVAERAAPPRRTSTA